MRPANCTLNGGEEPHGILSLAVSLVQHLLHPQRLIHSYVGFWWSCLPSSSSHLPSLSTVDIPLSLKDGVPGRKTAVSTQGATGSAFLGAQSWDKGVEIKGIKNKKTCLLL